MKLQVTGDGKGLEVQLIINWKSLATALTALLTLLAAPEIARLGLLLGWW